MDLAELLSFEGSFEETGILCDRALEVRQDVLGNERPLASDVPQLPSEVRVRDNESNNWCFRVR